MWVCARCEYSAGSLSLASIACRGIDLGKKLLEQHGSVAESVALPAYKVLGQGHSPRRRKLHWPLLQAQWPY